MYVDTFFKYFFLNVNLNIKQCIIVGLNENRQKKVIVKQWTNVNFLDFSFVHKWFSLNPSFSPSFQQHTFFRYHVAIRADLFDILLTRTEAHLSI